MTLEEQKAGTSHSFAVQKFEAGLDRAEWLFGVLLKLLSFARLLRLPSRLSPKCRLVTATTLNLGLVFSNMCLGIIGGYQVISETA